MKISWGVGITLFIIFFLLSTVGVVLYTTTIDVDLVAENYYEKELGYQKKIDKIKRTNQLVENLNIKISNNAIILIFPKVFVPEKIGGIIDLYYAADKKMDKKYKIKLNNKHQLLIPTVKMKKGYWKVKVYWNVADSLFYTEKNLMVN